MKEQIISMITSKIDELSPELDRAEQLFGNATLNEADWRIINDRRITCRIIEAKIMVLNQLLSQIKQVEAHELATV